MGNINELAASLPQNEETWFGLTDNNFGYSHHSSHNKKIEEEGSVSLRDDDNTEYEKQESLSNDRFCPPMSEVHRLRSILRKSKGGSVLVTGYRGTGKSSVVNYAITDILENTPTDSRGKSYYVPIRINLSTSREPMALVMMMIKELQEYSLAGRFDNKEKDVIEEAYERFVKDRSFYNSEEHEVSPSMGASLPFGLLGMSLSIAENQKNSHSESYQFHAYTLHEAQQDLIHCIKRLSARNYKLVFIFDELDKLVPESRHEAIDASQKKLDEIKSIVSSLKFLLSEANAFHIFIAGKIVDDSWQEDQNKGEGIFESIFVQNIYIPSTLSAVLTPPADQKPIVKHKSTPGNCVVCNQRIKREKPDVLKGKIYHLVLKAVGIESTHWSYNTGLLILPHFTEDEILMFINRGRHLKLFTTQDTALVKQYLEKIAKEHKEKLKKDKSEDEPLCGPCRTASQAYAESDTHYSDEKFSTGSRARRLRYLLQYLTYRGRGIPRKILREFYNLIRHRDDYKRELGQPITDKWWEKRGNPQYIVHLPKNIRYKIKFFSDIVSLLEKHHSFFDGIDDKGKVAIFYIIDYIFKFYRVGFSMTDIENASFMTHREELYPGRQLTEYVLTILEHHYIMRTDPRLREYIIRPRVRKNLETLFLAFGHEQMELRFTKLDLTHEINHLKSTISEMEKSHDFNQFDYTEIQFRLAYVFQLLENHQEARYEYTKALRWVRNQLQNTEQQLRSTNTAWLSQVDSTTKVIEILRCLGLMYELDCDLDMANQHYQSAIRHWYLAINKMDGFPEIRSIELLCNLRTNRRRRSYGENETLFHKTYYRLLPSTGDQIVDIDLVVKKITEPITETLPIPYDPPGIREMLNKTAIVMEKKWHRVSANKYLLAALEYCCVKHDEVNMVMQLIFIAEVLVRRRDLKSALVCYYYALFKSVHIQSPQQSFENGSTGKPDHSFELWGKLFEAIGDILYAFNDETELKSEFKNILKEIRPPGSESKLPDKFVPAADNLYNWSSICFENCNLIINKIDVATKRLRTIDIPGFATLSNNIIDDICEDRTVQQEEWVFLDRRRAALLSQLIGQRIKDMDGNQFEEFQTIDNSNNMAGNKDEHLLRMSRRTSGMFRKGQRILELSGDPQKASAEFFLLSSVTNTMETVDDKEVAFAYAELADLYQGIVDCASIPDPCRFVEYYKAVAEYYYRQKAITILFHQTDRRRCFSHRTLLLIDKQLKSVSRLVRSRRMFREQYINSPQIFIKGLIDSAHWHGSLNLVRGLNKTVPNLQTLSREEQNLTKMKRELEANIADGRRQQYRMPVHVIPEQKNIMDPVMHFEICDSLREGTGEK